MIKLEQKRKKSKKLPHSEKNDNGGSKSITVKATRNGKRATRFFGDRCSTEKEISIVDDVTIYTKRIKGMKNPTALVVYCPEPEVSSIKNDCDFTYVIDERIK